MAVTGITTVGHDVLIGDEADDVIRGAAGNDTISAGGGRDVIWGDSGHDQIDGGDGTDIAVFHGRRADYVVWTLNGVTMVRDANLRDGWEGISWLSNVERLVFADATVLLAPNEGQVAADDAVSGAENEPLVIPVSALLANDADPDGDPLSIVSVQAIAGGTAMLVTNDGPAHVLFIPDAGFVGQASFLYTVQDSTGDAAADLTGRAVVSVTIAAAAASPNEPLAPMPPPPEEASVPTPPAADEPAPPPPPAEEASAPTPPAADEPAPPPPPTEEASAPTPSAADEPAPPPPPAEEASAPTPSAADEPAPPPPPAEEAAPMPAPDPSVLVDWDALAIEVQANYAETGQWLA